MLYYNILQIGMRVIWTAHYWLWLFRASERCRLRFLIRSSPILVRSTFVSDLFNCEDRCHSSRHAYDGRIICHLVQCRCVKHILCHILRRSMRYTLVIYWCVVGKSKDMAGGYISLIKFGSAFDSFFLPL